MASNGPGLLVATWYVTSILPLTPREQMNALVGIPFIGGSTQIMVMGGTAAILLLWSWLALYQKTSGELNPKVNINAEALNQSMGLN